MGSAFCFLQRVGSEESTAPFFRLGSGPTTRKCRDDSKQHPAKKQPGTGRVSQVHLNPSTVRTAVDGHPTGRDEQEPGYHDASTNLVE
jgi:hypothetical protein